MAHDSDSTDPTATESITQPIRADWREHDSPCTAIVEVVAAATGREPTDLPPLYESIETDALDALVSASTDESTRVTFDYAGVEVTVRSHGEFEVRTDGAEAHRFNATPRTDSELNAQLEQLLGAASRNGVAVTGGWTIRNGPDQSDFEVLITRLTKPEEDSRDAYDSG